MKKRFLAAMLALVMVFSMIPVFAYAEDGETGETGGKTVNGLYMNKTYDAENSTLTLEAYTTGKVTITTTEHVAPCDIVLVLDQSGSMAYDFSGNSTNNNDNRRQKAMKDAVSAFIDNVAAQYDAEKSDHRIAIVTFDSSSTTLVGWTFVDASGAATLKGNKGVGGLPNSPSGATNVAAGMTTANTLLTNGSYTGPNTERQKIAIVFTDGVPTTNSDFDLTVANNAISTASNMKANGVSIYTIGIFNGADPARMNGDSYHTLLGDTACDGSVGSYWGASNLSGIRSNDFDDADIHAGNRFLNLLSSNFSDASNVGLKSHDSGLLGGHGWEITQNYSRDSDQYYFTASNAAGLTNVFTAISENVNTATSDSTLSSETVVKDVVSQYFNLPDNFDASRVTVAVAPCNGMENGEYTFGEEQPFADAVVSVDAQNKTVEVTNFDFAENFVGTIEQNGTVTGYHGNKLIIRFQIVDNGTGFGTVPTNTEDSGIYNGDEPVSEFPVPETEFPFFSIYHSSTGETEDVRMPEAGKTYNIAVKPVSGTLYGGYYHYEGKTKGAAYTENGLAMTPVENTTYYLKEVSADYLNPKTLLIYNTYYGNVIKQIYLVTAVDDYDYISVGFDGTDLKESAAQSVLYGQVELKTKDGESVKTYTLQNFFNSLSTGYLSVQKYSDQVGMTGEFTYVPYFVTLDGVKVTGTKTRTVNSTTGYKSGLTSDDNPVASTVTYVGGETTGQNVQVKRNLKVGGMNLNGIGAGNNSVVSGNSEDTTLTHTTSKFYGGAWLRGAAVGVNTKNVRASAAAEGIDIR